MPDEIGTIVHDCVGRLPVVPGNSGNHCLRRIVPSVFSKLDRIEIIVQGELLELQRGHDVTAPPQVIIAEDHAA